jgi:hypothetical protein
MLDADRPEQTDGADADQRTGGALVPVTPTVQWVHKTPAPRPDPSFVTQLIANAEQFPQASRLRRATPADARSAYGAKRQPPDPKGSRTRQIV